MNQHCWDAVGALLHTKYRLHTVELPGHGACIGVAWSLNRPKEFIQDLLTRVPDNALWVGWSLGGLIAQMAATQFPQQITRILCVSMGARFVSDTAWDAVLPSGLRKMRKEMCIHPDECMQAFIQQQYQHCSPEQQSELDAMIRCPYILEELLAGLSWLQSADYRAALSDYPGQVSFLAGEEDSIYPVLAVRNSAALCRQGDCEIIPQAGHALPVSHPQQLARKIEELIAR